MDAWKYEIYFSCSTGLFYSFALPLLTRSISLALLCSLVRYSWLCFAHSFDILGFALLTRSIFLALLCSLVRYPWLCFAHSFDILCFALLTREIFLALLCSLVRYPLLCSDVRYPLLCSLVRYPEGIKSQSGVNFVNYKLKGQYFRPFSSRLSTSPKITSSICDFLLLFDYLSV